MIFGTSLLRNTFVACIFCLSFAAFAQQRTLEIPDSLIRKDSIRQIGLLVVPFSSAMYFSDADRDISEVSKINQEEVNGRVSRSLESTVSNYLGIYYDAKSISKQNNIDDDLDIIHGSINYVPREKTEPGKGNNKPRQKPKRDINVQEKEPENYIDIAFDDARLISHLTEKYGVDYILFFNQFEIKTDYQNCIDLQLRKYSREIKLHYSVFSKDGKKISGDIITLPYHSNENDLQKIVKENFGEISRQLFNRIYLKQ